MPTCPNEAYWKLMLHAVHTQRPQQLFLSNRMSDSHRNRDVGVWIYAHPHYHLSARNKKSNGGHGCYQKRIKMLSKKKKWWTQKFNRLLIATQIQPPMSQTHLSILSILFLFFY